MISEKRANRFYVLNSIGYLKLLLYYYDVLMRNPEKMSRGKKVGPMMPKVASRLGAMTARNEPKPTDVLPANTRIVVSVT